MNGKAILGILLAASLSGNAAFLATAFASPAPQPAPLDRLSMTDDQKSRFESTQRSFQEARSRSHARMSELRGVIADELMNESPNRERLMSASIEMANVQTHMRPKVVDHLLALHALLTSEQRAALAEVMRSGRGAGCPGAGLYSDQGR